MNKKEQIDKIRLDVKNCKKCNLYKKSNTKMFGKGTGDPDVLFINGHPDNNENDSKQILYGEKGIKFNEIIKQINFNSQTYAYINAVKCYSSIKIDLNGDEIKQCKEWFDKQLDFLNPSKLIAMGGVAMKMFELSGKFKFGDVIDTSLGKVLLLPDLLNIKNEHIKMIQNFIDTKELNNMVTLERLIINKQKADNLSKFEMISSELSALHYFCKKANMDFVDVNQKDVCKINGELTFVKRFKETNEIDLFESDLNGRHKKIKMFVFYVMEKGNLEWIGWKDRKYVDDTEMGFHFKAEKNCKKIMYDTLNPISELIEIKEVKKTEKEIKIQSFIHLHTHSELSIGDGYGSMEQIAKTLKQKGFTSCALTDHGTLGGTIYFQKALLEQNVKPIFGCELYVTLEDELKAESFHVTVLVKNKQGWKNLNKLHEIGCSERFYYKPKVYIEDLIKYKEGLYIGSACLGGVLGKLTQQGNYDKAEMWLVKFMKNFNDNFYVELMPNRLKEQVAYNEWLVKMINKHKCEYVITTDSHYPNKDQEKFHKAVKAISWRKKYNESGFGDDTFYLLQEHEIKKLMKEHHPSVTEDMIDIAFAKTKKVEENCNYIIEAVTKDSLPKIYGDNAKEKLRELTIKGIKENTPYDYDTPEIKERIDMELERIISKDYENYFLIVHDYVKWCNENDIIVGPGRGSAGGSLVSMALGIIKVDTMKFDLLFARFLSPIRKDMPDIDLDFEDLKRPQLIQYLQEKYGKLNTSKIITYSRWHSKGAMRDIGRIFSIPANEINQICNVVVQRSGGDARASFCLADTFTEFEQAKKFKEKYPFESDIAIGLETHIRNCVAGDTRVLVLKDNNTCKGVKIKNLYKRKFKGKIRSYDFKKDILFFDDIIDIVSLGKKETIEIEVGSKKIRLTSDHLILTKKGWIQAGKLKIGELIATNGVFKKGRAPWNKNLKGDEYTKHFIKKQVWNKGLKKEDHFSIKRSSERMQNMNKDPKIREKSALKKTKHGIFTIKNSKNRALFLKNNIKCNMCKKNNAVLIHHIDENIKNNDEKNWKALCVSCHRKIHKIIPKQQINPERTIGFARIKNIKKDYKIEEVYDIKMKSKNHNFVANKIIVHNCGMHAAGLAITDKSISEYVPINRMKGEIVTAWEKREIESMGVIKFDILGLKTLSVINDTLNLVEKSQDKKVILPTEYEDKNVYDKVFSKGNTLGCFQLETTGLSKLCKQLKVNNFKLIYDATSLYRPGSLHSGQTADYVLRHLGKKEWDYDHPLLKPITKDTLGLIIYQEQIMQIMFDLGKFSWATAESARKIMTKSQGKDAFNKMRKEFIQNSEKYHGLMQEESGKIFDVVSTFGCLAGNSKVKTPEGFKYIENLKVGDKVNSVKEEINVNGSLKHNIIENEVSEFFDSGIKKTYKVIDEMGNKIICTDMHKFVTETGWKCLKDIQVGEKILINASGGKIKQKRFTSNALGQNSKLNQWGLNKEIKKNNLNSTVITLKKIKSIKLLGEIRTFDIAMKNTECPNYIAENFIVHNSYGFNKSHAVEYSIISYWTAWLKTYYPKEFFAALLSREKDANKIADYIRDAKKFADINILTPNINYSKIGYSFLNKDIISGFDSIKGIADRSGNKIIKSQPYKNLNDYITKNKPSISIFKSLVCSGVFDEFNSNRKYLFDNAEMLIKNKGQSTLISRAIQTKDWSDKERQIRMSQYLDLPSETPLIDLFDNPFKDKIQFEKIGELEFDEPITERWIKGVVTFINFKQEGLEGQWTMFDNVLERRYAHLNITDGTGNVLVHLSPEQYTYYKKYLEKGTGFPVIIKGHSIKDFQKVYCDAMIVLDNIDWENPIIPYIYGRVPDKIKELKEEHPKLKVSMIDSVTYKVSKNKKPYVRLGLSNEKNKFLMNFKLTPKIYIAGEIIAYKMQEPFLNIHIRTQAENDGLKEQIAKK